jgi:endonuclease YncB( thermonuclease family)
MARIIRFDQRKRYAPRRTYRGRSRFSWYRRYWVGKLGILTILLVALIARGQALKPADGGRSRVSATASAISVVDGDTVRSNGYRYRLVGFDTPEMGNHARCERERTLASAATERLRQLLTEGEISLERVACACRSGTEGTASCNYGRLCGVLKVSDRDVGSILISEGLARPYNCSGSHCPRRQSWCD